jgi:hypothetical protein
MANGDRSRVKKDATSDQAAQEKFRPSIDTVSTCVG